MRKEVIREYRERIFSAHVAESSSFPRVTQLPEGLFGLKQLERWRRAQPLIDATVDQIMADLVIANYVLETDFSDSAKFRSRKRVDYILKYREGEAPEQWQEETSYKEVRFYYDAGGRFTPDMIGSKYVYLVVPKKHKNAGWFDLEQAAQWINHQEANTFCCASIGSNEVSQENIQKLLMIILACPALVQNAERQGVVPRTS